MTVRATGRPLTRLEATRAHAERVLGARKAKRIAAFDSGALYVRAGTGAQAMAWLIDFTVFLFGVGAGFVALSLVDREVTLSDNLVSGVGLSLLVVVPLLYGLCYGNGRALGALLTGTQLVRTRDGGRIGLKACWAMLVRTLLMPVLVVVLVVTAFSTGSSDAPGSLVRTSIDRDATRRLHDAGIR
ncbi:MULTISPECIES: RDD family protein [unclassified Micromonospora]|uniref:RDD family protein n=1 Tax=unclassified Micromonospora TaxID=2617518 RepID=UPI001B387E8B|nr:MULTISPECIES: RDD family protein [unclassified Micromonospora]MBQ1046585.1 RDD family protein [Micromonospora sp. C72]MBQ1055834.1 RDD family protein [Micromonospora sp. C32]